MILLRAERDSTAGVSSDATGVEPGTLVVSRQSIPRSEWTRYFRIREWHDLEVLHARFVRHTFARHAHDYFVIGYVEQGVQAYSYRGARHLTPAGQIFLVNPDEPHTGEAATDEGYVYRTLYPRASLLEEIAHDVGGRNAQPFFTHAVVHDRHLSALFAAFHRTLAEPRSRLAAESLLRAALARVVTLYSDLRLNVRRIGRERVAIRRAREYVDACFAEDITLAQLSMIAALSPFHFTRAFEQAVGLPPHAYLETVRIRRARELLDAGQRIADVAVAVGYADQSHLTHRFKRLLGITPGQYVHSRLHPADAKIHKAPRR